MDEIEKQVIEVVGKELGVDPNSIKSETSFVCDLKADSLSQMELVLAVEERFDIEIPDDVAENLKTVNNVVEFIRSVK